MTGMNQNEKHGVGRNIAFASDSEQDQQTGYIK